MIVLVALAALARRAAAGRRDGARRAWSRPSRPARARPISARRSPCRSGRCAASTNFARRGRGLATLRDASDRSTAPPPTSPRDILRCDELQPRSLRPRLHLLDGAGRLPAAAAGGPARTSPGARGRSARVRSIFQRLDALRRATARTSSAPSSRSASALRSRQPRRLRRRPRLDPALRRPRLLKTCLSSGGMRARQLGTPRMRACPTPSTSATATAFWPPS